MSLTEKQRMINAVFFERVFHQLNENGMWIGDSGIMKKKTMPGIGQVFLANFDTYIYLKETVPSFWLSRRVVLFADLSK